MSEGQESRALTAQYSSPNGSHDFIHTLSAQCTPNAAVAERTAYLGELRAGTKKLQETVNAFLTQKMEEDKDREASEKGSKAKAQKTQDEIEEETYGEEPADGD